MPTIPPPGPKRDTEIAQLLGNVDYFSGPMGWFYVYPEDGGGYRDANHFGQPSTDSAPCDRLVEEMGRRGWSVVVESSQMSEDGPVWHSARVSKGDPFKSGIWSSQSRPDAVSAAALLALTGGTA